MTNLLFAEGMLLAHVATAYLLIHFTKASPSRAYWSALAIVAVNAYAIAQILDEL